MKTIPFLVVVALVLVAGGCADGVRSDAPFRDALMQRLASVPAYAKDDPESWSVVKASYRANGQGLLWLGGANARAHVAHLRAAIAGVQADGLDPAQYDLGDAVALEPIEAGMFGKLYEPATAVESDVRITFVLARLAHDLEHGRMAPPVADKHSHDDTRDDLSALIQKTANSGDIEATLAGLAPRDPQYARLRQTLAHYREIAARGGWPIVPPIPRLKAGADSPEIPALRARLAADGYLESADERATLDPELQQALARFQLQHGLESSGTPDAATVNALNIPVESRIEQLKLNLERWRWLPADLGDPRIVVNVPTFELNAIENGRSVLRMRVVTGKAATPTPIFSGTMQTVVFSPYWNVPSSILKGEVLPELQKDPNYLERKNMEVVRNGTPVDANELSSGDPSLRVRQRPGAANALGHVSFMFPNEYDVYLHDTPMQSLFAKRGRGLSHGCIRIEKPFDMAQWVLREQSEWTPETIDAAMNSGEERHVALKRKIPVYIVYQTAWVGDDGSVQFADDLYGHDRRQLALLAAAPRMASSATERMAAK